MIRARVKVISLVDSRVVSRAVVYAGTTEPKSLSKSQQPIMMSVDGLSTFSISSSLALRTYWLRRRSFGSSSSNWSKVI